MGATKPALPVGYIVQPTTASHHIGIHTGLHPMHYRLLLAALEGETPLVFVYKTDDPSSVTWYKCSHLHRHIYEHDIHQHHVFHAYIRIRKHVNAALVKHYYLSINN